MNPVPAAITDKPKNPEMYNDVFFYLLAGRTVIANKKDWTQFTFARDTYGNTVGTENQTADKFCAIGALKFVNEVPYAISDKAEDLLSAASLRLFQYSIVDVNDEFGHAKVLKAYDLAMEWAWEQAQ